jgi:hypothetical protein
MQKMFFSQKFEPLSIFMFNKLDNYNPVIIPLPYSLFLIPYYLFFYSPPETKNTSNLYPAQRFNPLIHPNFSQENSLSNLLISTLK